jgi:hypothetical protein
MRELEVALKSDIAYTKELSGLEQERVQNEAESEPGRERGLELQQRFTLLRSKRSQLSDHVLDKLRVGIEDMLRAVGCAITRLPFSVLHNRKMEHS